MRGSCSYKIVLINENSVVDNFAEVFKLFIRLSTNSAVLFTFFYKIEKVSAEELSFSCRWYWRATKDIFRNIISISLITIAKRYKMTSYHSI